MLKLSKVPSEICRVTPPLGASGFYVVEPREIRRVFQLAEQRDAVAPGFSAGGFLLRQSRRCCLLVVRARQGCGGCALQKMSAGNAQSASSCVEKWVAGTGLTRI